MLLIAIAFGAGLGVEHYLGIYDKSIGRVWAYIRNKF